MVYRSTLPGPDMIQCLKWILTNASSSPIGDIHFLLTDALVFLTCVMVLQTFEMLFLLADLGLCVNELFFSTRLLKWF